MRVGERVYALGVRDLPAEDAVLAVVRDRTDELRRELAEREFVSNAAHELRNPIAGISGAIEVLRAGAKDDPEARDHFLARLAEDAERVTRLTDSLLTLARIEAVGEGRTEALDVGIVIEEAAQAVAPPGRARVEVDVEADLAAQGDSVLLRQVLIGLLTNAFKNTPPPGVVTLRARRTERARFLIEVTDTGKGIAPEEVERIFERFYRGSGSLEQEGFGLGLSIAKRMVDVMGGEIGVESEVGVGQHVLGAPAGRRAGRHPGGVIAMTDGRILIADDEPSVRDAVGYALQQEGFDVTLAEDGDDADRKLGDDAPSYDLLILDIMMPGRSGLDICRDVRARSPVPIILLTAKDAEVDKVVGLEVGADDYVTKPFSVRELLGRVRAQLRRRELDRASSDREGKTIEAGPVRIDLARHLVTIRRAPVNLTRSEFQVLRLLAERPGQVFSRLEIMEELWQSEFSGDVRACDVHISNLRQKIERDPQDPELVLTVRGVGYRLAEGASRLNLPAAPA